MQLIFILVYLIILAWAALLNIMVIMMLRLANFVIHPALLALAAYIQIVHHATLQHTTSIKHLIYVRLAKLDSMAMILA